METEADLELTEITAFGSGLPIRYTDCTWLLVKERAAGDLPQPGAETPVPQGRPGLGSSPGRSAGQMAAAARTAGRRLRPLYVTAFLQGLVFWYGVEKLFLRQIGLGDYLIAVSTVIYIGVMTLANTPIGILADRWSRKGVLHLGTLALAGSSLVCGLSHGFWMYVAGISLWGMFYACQGTLDAVTYDVVLEELGNPDSFERYYGRVQMFDYTANLAGSLASALVVHYTSLRCAFLLSIPVTCLALGSLTWFREPVLHRQVHAGLSGGSRVRQVARALLSGQAVIWLVASLALEITAFRLLFEFGQLWYLGMALPAVLFGPGTALLCLGATTGGFLAGRLRRKRAGLLLVCALTTAASAGLLSRWPVLVIGAQLLTVAGITILDVMLKGYLHDRVPSDIRASVSSAATTAGYAVFIPVALGFGAISGGSGIFAASWLVTGLLAGLLLAAAFLPLGRHARTATASKRWRAGYCGRARRPAKTARAKAGTAWPAVCAELETVLSELELLCAEAPAPGGQHLLTAHDGVQRALEALRDTASRRRGRHGELRQAAI